MGTVEKSMYDTAWDIPVYGQQMWIVTRSYIDMPGVTRGYP